MSFLGGAPLGDFPELLFPLGLIFKALAILVQSQGIISFWNMGRLGSRGDWTISVLEHHVLLIVRRFLGLGPGLSWDDFFVGFWFL